MHVNAILLWFNAVSGCLLYLTKQLISVWLGLCYSLNAGYGRNFFKLIYLRSDQINLVKREVYLEKGTRKLAKQ